MPRGDAADRAKEDFRVRAAGWKHSLVGQEASGEMRRPTTLVDIRGTNLSDSGSIPDISTLTKNGLAPFFVLIDKGIFAP